MGIGRVFKRTWKLPDGSFKESPTFRSRTGSTVGSAWNRRKQPAKRRPRLYCSADCKEIGKGAYALHQEKFFYSDMVDLMKADYARKGNRSWKDVSHKIKPLTASFEFTRAADIDLAKINNHIDRRIEERVAIHDQRRAALPPPHAPAILQARKAQLSTDH